MSDTMSPKALEALRTIRTLSNYHKYPQTSLAEKRILTNLGVQDFLDVVTALEADTRLKTSVPRG
jgi:hypothetical protein